MKKSIFRFIEILILSSLIFTICGCSSCSCTCNYCKNNGDCKQCDCMECFSGNQCEGCKCVKTAENRPLNISIFLDLSNRLTTGIYKQNPQLQLDTAIVGKITDWFREKTMGAHILQSENRIKVFFNPAPSDSKVLSYAKALDYDITKYKGIERRKTVEELHKTFLENLCPIYEGAIHDKQWLGCDIWGFFSNSDVDNLCMRKGFRNIVFIVTDGYLIYDGNKNIPNANLTPSCLNIPNFTLSVKRKGLEDLEVCVLEINPNNPTQREPLIRILKTWFTDMGVKTENLTIATTDLPNNTETIIENFLDKK